MPRPVENHDPGLEVTCQTGELRSLSLAGRRRAWSSGDAALCCRSVRGCRLTRRQRPPKGAGVSGGLGRAVSALELREGFERRLPAARGLAIEVCDGRNVVSFCGPRGVAQRDRGKSRCAMTGARWASVLWLATTSFEKVTNGHGVVAVGAGAAQADCPHRRPVVGAVPVADGPFAATVALVDGDRPLGALARHRDFGCCWLVAPAESLLPALAVAITALPLGGEAPATDRAAPRRRLIVTRRVGAHFAPLPLGPPGRGPTAGFSLRLYDSPSITSSKAALWRRSTADWASIGSAISASHSLGSRLELTTVAARRCRSTTRA